ncbi:MAG: hypothetical protein LKK19_04795, partial [Bacteroidales bacterium]|nr:hypothetical protein [Bacteroidales bacterium]
MANRKGIVIFFLLLFLLVAGTGIVLYKVFPPRKGKEGHIQNAGCIRGIPADACAVLLFNDFGEAGSIVDKTSSIFAGLFPSEGGLVHFTKKVLSLSALGGGYESFLHTDASFSFHSPFYGGLSVLLCVTIPRQITCDAVLSSLRKYYRDAESFRYDSVSVFHSESGGVYFAATGSKLIASESAVLLHSSVRHISSGISILDNDDFRDTYKSLKAPAAFYFHNTDSDKFFSAILDSKSSKNVASVGGISDWSALAVNFSEYGFSFSGVSFSEDSRKKFTEVMRGQMPSETSVYKVLPYYTFAVASLKISDRNAFLKAYLEFLDANRRATRYELTMNDSLKQWFEKQTVSEIALAGIQVSGKTEWINLFRTDKVLDHNPKDWNWLGSRYLSLFGRASCEEITLLPGWVITGSSAAIREYVSNNALYVTLDEYLSRNDVESETSDKSVLSLYFNFDSQGKRAYRMFRKPLSGRLAEVFDSTSFEMLTCRFSNDENNGMPDISGNFDALYAEEILNDFVKDTVREVHQGPFKIVNPATGEVSYLEQLPNNYLRYSDSGGKGLWAAPLGNRIAGYVTPVDLYGDGNYEMLFAAGDKFYYLDRNARYVGRTPRSLGKQIAGGPKVFSIRDSAKVFMVLFADNSIGLYTLEGNLYRKWRGIECREAITELPELLETGGHYYWVLRTAVQTIVCHFDGTRVAVFEKNSRLKPKSEIAPVEGSVVRV